MGVYSDINEAIEKCDNDTSCMMIGDENCAGSKFVLCKNHSALFSPIKVPWPRTIEDTCVYGNHSTE